MTIEELYDASMNPLILYDGTRILAEFLETYGKNNVDMFCIDWKSNRIVVFPEGCYTIDDRKRWNV